MKNKIPTKTELKYLEDFVEQNIDYLSEENKKLFYRLKRLSL